MAKRANNEGSVFEVKTGAKAGKWIAQVRVGGGKYVTRQADTQKAALAKLRELTAEQSTGVVVRGDLTLSDLIDEWTSRDLPATTWTMGEKKNARAHCEHWRKVLGSRKVSAIGVIQIEDAMVAMSKGRKRPYSHETMTKRRAFLGQVFDAAIKRRHITFNPVRLANLPADAPRTDARRALTVDQANALIRHTAERRNGAAFLLGLTLGLRPGELYGMPWSAVDFKRGTIHVSQTVTMETGRPVIVNRTKTKGSTRTLGVPPFVMDALRAHQTAQRDAMVAEGWRTDIVFANPETGGPMDLGVVRDHFAKACDALGFGDDWTPNQMRHTAATLLSDYGLTLEQIADILGHTTTRMVERHYRQTHRAEKTAHVDTMGTLFGSSKRRKRSS